ncbi:YhfC family intramembrane metalloprotease [Candidatus Aerophobetes bacterium]|nr:YhfC family intramembrane metalloprotease [Candidatus Aerophobetes bacterium]
MKLSPLFIASGLGMIIVGFLFIIYWRTKTKVNYLPFLSGALVWIVSVALKFAWAIPINKRLLNLLLSVLGNSFGNLIFWIYVGLLTGIFECGITYLFIKYSKMRKYNYNQAVSFGIGFGSVEAILLGVVSLYSVLVAILRPDLLPGNVLQAMRPQNLLVIPAPIVERLFTIVMHTFSSVLIFCSIKNKVFSLFWLSFVYKTVIDAIAAWGNLSFNINILSHLWIIELIVIIYGVTGFYGIKRIKSRY